MNRLKQMFKKVTLAYPLLTTGLVIVLCAAIIVGVLPPLVLERIVNGLADNVNPGFTLVLLYVGLLIISGVLDAAKEVMITVYGQKVTHGIRSVMSHKLSVLPMAYYVKNSSGTITSRIVNDVDTVETLFASGIISMIVDVCRVISIIVIIFIKSTGLGIMMLITTPVLSVLTRVIQKKMFKAQLDNRKAVARANNHLPETVNNIRMIHTMECESFMEKQYEKYIDESYDAVERSNFYDAVYSPIIVTISAVIVSVMMIFAAMDGEFQSFFGMSVGTAVAVISYVSKVFTPLENIGMEIQNIQSAVAGIYRINEFLDEEENPKTEILCNDMNQDKWTEESVPAVELKNVCFGYDKDVEVLQDYNMKVDRCENKVLRGRTGIGKSTVFKLILGLYEPWSGEVLIEGIPVKNIPNEKRASIIGYVEQSFHPVRGTIRDQITLKNPDISDDDVNRALKLVGLYEMVTSLERGLDTEYEKGIYFSQGQIELLAIARAVAGNPRILLFDEITANMDSATEKMVLDALDTASRDRTVISISHRENAG